MAPTSARVLATSGVVESADQVGIEAPGGSLRSREVRYLRVRVPDRRRLDRLEPDPASRGRPPGGIATGWPRRSRCPTIPGATASRRARSCGASSRSAATSTRARLYVTALGRSRRADQRRAGQRRAARALDGRHTTNDCSPTRTTSRRACAPGRTSSSRGSATAGIADASAGTRARTAAATDARSASSRSSSGTRTTARAIGS